MSPTRSSRAPTIRLLAGLLLPLLVFVVLVGSLASATEALAITDAIPLVWVVAYAAWRRRIEPVAVTAAGVFAVALLVTIASGGSSLPLELHRAVFPGLAGMTCLVSLAARRPLLAKLAKSRPTAIVQTQPKLDTPDAHGALTTLTAIVGTTLIADAAAQIILAFTVSTSTFGVVARVASYVIVGTGLGVCTLYLRRLRGRLHNTAESQPPPPNPKPQPDGPAAPGRAAACGR